MSLPKASSGIMQAWGGGDDAKAPRKLFPRLSAIGSMAADYKPSLRACKVARMDEVDPEALDEDPVHKMLNKLGEEYSRQQSALRSQIDSLRRENDELKQRLNVVLSSTWSFSDESWHGASRDPEVGELQLSCSPNSRSKKSNPVWNVSEEERALTQVSTVVNFRPRVQWPSINELAQNPPKKRSSRATTVNIRLDGHRAEVVQRTKGGMRHFIVSPTSSLRLVWDVACVALLLYDMVMIPLDAFDLAETTFTRVMNALILGFWTVDLVLSFFTGYTAQGVTVMRPRQIAKNYLKFWFWLDLAVVGCDWVFTIMEATSKRSGDEAKISGLLRAFRVVRMMRLLRVARLRKLLDAVKDRIESEATFLVIKTSQIVVMLVLSNHILGALWYYIGKRSREEGETNWIEMLELDAEPFPHRYFASLHWALANFAPGGSPTRPYNTAESVYASVVLLIGMIALSAFIGEVSSMMIKFQDLQSEASKQLWLLRRYLRQNGVRKPLSSRVLSYLDYACNNQTHIVAEGRLKVLTYLSDQLRCELKYSVSYGHLLGHPLFRSAEETAKVVMHSLVDSALSVKPLVSQDMLFQHRILSTHMYMVVSGQLVYMRDGSPDQVLSGHDWMCEPALWTIWVSRGDAMAISDAEVILLDVHAFIEVVQRDENLKAMMSAYAEVFIEGLNQVAFDDLTDVSRYPYDVTRNDQLLQDSRARMESLNFARRHGTKQSRKETVLDQVPTLV